MNPNIANPLKPLPKLRRHRIRRFSVASSVVDLMEDHFQMARHYRDRARVVDPELATVYRRLALEKYDDGFQLKLILRRESLESLCKQECERLRWELGLRFTSKTDFFISPQLNSFRIFGITNDGADEPYTADYRLLPDAVEALRIWYVESLQTPGKAVAA